MRSEWPGPMTCSEPLVPPGSLQLVTATIISPPLSGGPSLGVNPTQQPTWPFSFIIKTVNPYLGEAKIAKTANLRQHGDLQADPCILCFKVQGILPFFLLPVLQLAIDRI